MFTGSLGLKKKLTDSVGAAGGGGLQGCLLSCWIGNFWDSPMVKVFLLSLKVGFILYSLCGAANENFDSYLDFGVCRKMYGWGY